jgi:hypothetical protein
MKIPKIQCNDFDTNCCNSDAGCFVWVDFLETLSSKIKVIKNPDVCDICPYNMKFENFTYDQFEELKTRVNKLKK